MEFPKENMLDKWLEANKNEEIDKLIEQQIKEAMKKKIITLIIYTVWMSIVAFFSPFIYDWYMELVGDTDALFYVGLWAVFLCFAKIALWGYLAARIADEEIE